MNNLKNSIAFLVLYLTIIYGVAQVRYIEENVLNFNPAFFILITVAVLAGIFTPTISSRVSIYVFLIAWSIVYMVIWAAYWRTHQPPLSLQVLGLQFLLMEISAGLAFDVGRHLSSVTELFEGLAGNAYPNRTMDFANAEARIGAELTRSRRYHHPLSLLIVELDNSTMKDGEMRFDALRRDLLDRFAVAKVGQLISERARETDLILHEKSGRFILLCPETNYESSKIFAERIGRAVKENMHTEIVWSSASFPDEALTFEELLERAEQRLTAPETFLSDKVSSDVG